MQRMMLGGSSAALSVDAKPGHATRNSSPKMSFTKTSRSAPLTNPLRPRRIRQEAIIQQMPLLGVLAHLGFAAIMTLMSPRPGPKRLMFFWFFTLSAFALSTAFCVVNLVFCLTEDDGFGVWFTLFAGVA